MRKPYRAIYDIRVDSVGNVEGTPRNKRERRRIARHMREIAGYPQESFYLQVDTDVEVFFEDLTPVQRRDIEHGWTVGVLLDPWIAAHYFGYDCHTLYE